MMVKYVMSPNTPQKRQIDQGKFDGNVQALSTSVVRVEKRHLYCGRNVLKPLGLERGFEAKQLQQFIEESSLMTL